MTAKPTDDILWAESAGGTDVLDPNAKRANGWVENDPLPYNNLNYLLRAGGRYSSFCAEAFGATNDQLTLTAQHGYVELTDDPANVGAGEFHTYHHIATGTSVASRWRADVVQADTAVILGSDTAAGGTHITLDNNIKMLAKIRLTVNAGGTDWDATLLEGFNAAGVSASAGTGSVTVTLTDTTDITVRFAQLTSFVVFDGGGSEVAGYMLTPQLRSATNSGIVSTMYYYNGTTQANFITSYPAGGTIGHRVDLMIMAN